MQVTLADSVIETPKPKTTKKVSKKETSDIITLEENKLVFPQSFLDTISANPGDRIAIRFGEYDGKYFPVIAKSEAFADPESGNKLTKSCTISYKGKQHDELAIYGTKFKWVETSEGSQICKLIGENGDIIPEDKVFKGNRDLDPYPVDNIKDKVVNTELDENQSKTYIPELSRSTDLNISEEDFNALGLNIDEIEVSDDIEDFLNSI